ncbi:arylsulfatase [Thiobacillus sp.]|uniref:arylsulfatase n=1 Tax=Thiobacillus sp. TaxID=924 RepID=UPI0025E7E38B|nr:arylsulfatase [Thiobacillus sp.]
MMNKHSHFPGLMALILISLPAVAVGVADGLDRTVLPIHVPDAPLYDELDARNATPPPRVEIKAPKNAPNVLIILLDDMGFGVPSTFGGPARMPTLDRLANEGLRFNQFHTTALCAPTRTALLSGRNHHMNNMGSITETATAFPGNTGQRPDNVAPLAAMLRYNGYSTAHIGKNHETAAWEISPSGPTDRWPIRNGFDKFYGFFGGETNQWSPLVYDGMTPVELPNDPKYNFMTDMTNRAVEWVNYQQALTPDKPFFMYFAPGATHAPHHVPPEWIAKYKGKFDQGWDKLREETLARQIKLGVVPKGTQLAPMPDAIKQWASLSANEKKLFARQMETFAAFAEYADAEIGRLLKAVDDLGELDNTLVFYIAGDNGTSAEGGMNGMFNEYTYLNGVPETVEDQLQHFDHWGDATTYPHMAAGWAIAGDTPFAWSKQIGSDFGGTRNGMVVRWPKGIKAKGELRSQFTHVIDVTPTILEAAGLPEPTEVNGIKQVPIQGKSMLSAFADGKAPMRSSQYFEIIGNRAIYRDGWFARVIHKAPWEQAPRAKLKEDTWELFDTRNDFSLVNNLAAKNPQKLKALQELFMREARVNHVLPIDDRGIERLNPQLAGRPDLMGGRTSLTLYSGMKDLSENVFINIKNKSHAIIAEVDIPASGAEGVVLAQGGRFGGWSFHVKDGKPSYTYNFLGMNRSTIGANKVLPAGKHTLRYEFTYDGGGIGKGGTGKILVDGKTVAEGRIERTQGMIFSLDESADVGMDNATPVLEDYKASHGVFAGKVNKVTVDVTPANKNAL